MNISKIINNFPILAKRFGYKVEDFFANNSQEKLKKMLDETDFSKLSKKTNKINSENIQELMGKAKVLNDNKKLAEKIYKPEFRSDFLIKESLESGASMKEAYKGAEVLMSATKMEELPKSAEASAKAMHEAGLF